MPRHNKTGRSRGEGRYLALPFDVIESYAYLDLSVAARAVLIEIGRLYNGSNNGLLALSVRQAAERCKVSKDTISRSLQELEDHGLIETVQKRNF